MTNQQLGGSWLEETPSNQTGDTQGETWQYEAQLKQFLTAAEPGWQECVVTWLTWVLTEEEKKELETESVSTAFTPIRGVFLARRGTIVVGPPFPPGETGQPRDITDLEEAIFNLGRAGWEMKNRIRSVGTDPFREVYYFKRRVRKTKR